MSMTYAVSSALTDEEAYLFAILQDHSGLDLAEFSWFDGSTDDGCFRAWPFQWNWWRDRSPKQIDQCLPAGTMVLTDIGQVPIEEIIVGDSVLTHESRWKPVTHVWDRGEQETVTIRGHGHWGLDATPDHKFLLESGWQPPDRGDRWTTPCSFPLAVVPPMPERLYKPGRPSNIPHDVNTVEFMWLYGLYAAEGSCSSSFGAGGTLNRVTWSVHESEVDYVTTLVEKVGLRYNTSRVGTEACFNIVVNSRQLAEWMAENGGRGSRTMHLKPWVFGLDHDLRVAVLDGAVYGDGHTRPGGRIEYATTSRRLAIDIKLLAQSLGWSVGINRPPGPIGMINGRRVIGGDRYVVGWQQAEALPNSRSKKDGQYRRSFISSVEAGRSQRCFDIEVADDHSFVADGIIVSNCARAVGKSLSIKARMFAFPFRHPGQEAVITAPELIHLEPIINLIEDQFYSTRLGREMMQKGRSAVTHRPFMMNFRNSARLMGRIPQKDGKGVKGCVGEGTPILTKWRGYVPVEDLEVGELVLTHKGNWRPVQALHVDVNDAYEVRGQGSFPIVVSCDHRFMGSENAAGPKQKRDLLPLGFHDIEFLLEHQVYWATPTQVPHVGIPDDCSCGLLPGTLNVDLAAFWWLVGRWIADGYCSMDRKKNKARKVHWVVHPKDQHSVKAALAACGMHYNVITRAHSSADVIEVYSHTLYHWLTEQFGEHADGKHLPTWALGMPREFRNELLDGYLAGDGHWNAKRNRWEAGTASKRLAVGMQVLAQTLGYTVNCTMINVKPNAVCASPKPSWRLQIGHGHPVLIGDHLVSKVKSVKPVGRVKIYNPVIEDDHSYVSGSIVSHNIHPLQLELDEAQDYPRRGWTELNATLKSGFDDSEWRAHGVTRGVRDKFYEYTQDKPGNSWKVHRMTAMHRPNWTAQEREDSIQLYGGHRDDPDYRRNILGLHGDATNPLFVVTRLYSCVDDDESSDYNSHEYVHLEISDLMVEDLGPDGDVTDLLLFPDSHRDYDVTWCGMDVGYTHDPSEILVWGEYQPDAEERKAMANRKKACPKVGLSRFKLLARISLKRVPNLKQVRLILGIIAFYQPKAFGLDKTGVGLPLFQDLLAIIREEGDFSAQAQAAADIIKGYNFAAKVVVDIDDTVEVDESEDVVKEAGIHRNVLEQSTDALRGYVDTERLWLPWDDQLLAEFEGQTFSYSKSAIDQFGRARRVFSEGRFHALDASRMFAMAHSQQAIEAIVGAKNENEAVIARFYQPDQ